ncbi:MAG: tRNA (adenosine(37)-N6)-threonylcarbamoyltransferase complex dimerization subunit type 1 TsaB [Eubacteriales bacterium]|nr:tRNA (adenosine(37)-N6)-threonylcarbamoyltransferase complex dimerization subunit type 1 TsaB [Eubacteriales bacterium]MDD4121354.1 tRNA (adenosine(37)-N6)-threonylcarbamoyltransferase complex dimerization subunit type 1 TsaB [Eubacteriales bacterium]MDD4629804.1 tRNA (adenosine(37)-N6)-threonylcarbamoyltransferase complex dimerization subunit type 1 TsaB [Eubacteriales bacterium]
MNILAIETTGAEASVALINENEEVFMEASDQKMNHLQNLMPMVDILLKKRELTINDIAYMAVSEGPGSFTGIRIGVASARALAQALEIDTISVPTLQSFLYHVPDYRGIICPIFDAKRDQVYGGAFQWICEEDAKETVNCVSDRGKDQHSYREVVTGGAYDLPQLLMQLRAALLTESSRTTASEVTFFGDGIMPYKKQIEEWQKESSNDNIRILFAENDCRFQKASSVARLALQLLRDGRVKNYNDLKPVYMRKAEAERRLEEKS